MTEVQRDALFRIEGPNEDGCVWICSPEGSSHVWCENLGPKEQAAQVMSQWLGSIDYDEVEIERYERPNPG